MGDAITDADGAFGGSEAWTTLCSGPNGRRGDRHVIAWGRRVERNKRLDPKGCPHTRTREPESGYLCATRQVARRGEK
jgi:hypothetical protein